MSTAGKLIERVQFESPDMRTGIWTHEYECRAEFIYARGGEAVYAARLEGRSVFKIKIRQCAAAREILQSWRMIDMRRATYEGDVPQTGVYNIREVDPISDRAWIYLLVEAGVAYG
ncbi:phage head completion protein [Ketogulonicigenium vulgare]|uniref:Phage head-tail adaptor, putative n=1 Tax=Ketogulonicigenium vulgare (strain WSH-001) TaxID=759362 RepID=F9YA01_KETVW|nr:head-tail adaptor protein [Ketogulonicigenium vulgare]ADO43120.1 conserved hypothetical protein [Ketogulonicigenium vulgare Y25]AEM41412.1 Phage head-tail adaptor, putative [Ketogulonicigenium vulgare WSH-001]ALJ81544.1 head-tail adaptor protein [Ketogulonicigenium vulgare]ANW34242.1 head-tail adaptor protein [Ketogulonicigenium vulgare]AOZ55155.1 hypothetical protein KVC_2148 [Ketogulonicigenium vulgare]